MRRWSLVAAAFAAGLAVTVTGFVRGGDALACKVSGQIFCAHPDRVAEGLTYVGLALLTVAILTAVVTVARTAVRD